MPRIDRGWKAVDVSVILAGEPREWASLAVSERALLVTYPASVVVRTDAGVTSVTLGVGSLVFPPDARVEGLQLSRPEWVDGCYSVDYAPPERPAVGGKQLTPPLLGLDIRDPVALFANGMFLEGILGDVEGLNLVVDSRGETVVAVEGEDYILAVAEGPAVGPLEYIIGLYSPCKGR